MSADDAPTWIDTVPASTANRFLPLVPVGERLAAQREADRLGRAGREVDALEAAQLLASAAARRRVGIGDVSCTTSSPARVPRVLHVDADGGLVAAAPGCGRAERAGSNTRTSCTTGRSRTDTAACPRSTGRSSLACADVVLGTVGRDVGLVGVPGRSWCGRPGCSRRTTRRRPRCPAPGRSSRCGRWPGRCRRSSRAPAGSWTPARRSCSGSPATTCCTSAELRRLEADHACGRSPRVPRWARRTGSPRRGLVRPPQVGWLPTNTIAIVRLAAVAADVAAPPLLLARVGDPDAGAELGRDPRRRSR